MGNTTRIPRIIAALHLPPFPGSTNSERKTLSEISNFALRNVENAVKAGVDAIILQDLGEHPFSKDIQPYITASITAVGAKVRANFPDLDLGISLLGNSAKEPLAIAQAIGASFIRLKVYVGAMVKAEGIIEGCAAEAIQYRHQINADQIAILADVYDRTGIPLGRQPLVEEVRHAYVFGLADAIILTGSNFKETMSMIDQIKTSDITPPIVIGGGVNKSNVASAFEAADSVIVSSAFKPQSGFTRESINMDWDLEKMTAFVKAAKQ